MGGVMSERPLRVLVATAMYPTAEDPGRGAFVASQVESLRRAGIEVKVLAFAPRGGVRGYLGAARQIRREVRRYRPDLVHAHYGLMGWSAKWQNAPLVTSFCGDDLFGTISESGAPTLRSRIGILLSQWAAARSAGLICKSDELRASVWRAPARARAVVLPNGVDITRFSPGDRRAARRALGLPESAPIALFPHTPDAPNKRLGLANEAMQLVRREFPDAMLHMPERRIPHAEMPQYYRASNVLLLTSEREGSPNVVKEALCCGIPVVTTDVGDVRRWVRESHGFVVDATPRSIADALVKVFRRPPALDAERIRRELSEDGIAQQIIAYYDAVLARGIA
jgi:glycosyltransferase involved in cell wall biosynthesis